MPPSTQCIDPKCKTNVAKTDLGICPTCGKGRIRAMYSRAGKRFAGCSAWPECTQTYPLRPRGSIEPTDEQCPVCGAPIIVFSNTRSCINPDCGSRKKSAAKAIPEGETKVVVVKSTTVKKKTSAKKATASKK
jgi:DNA topoisomerase I